MFALVTQDGYAEEPFPVTIEENLPSLVAVVVGQVGLQPVKVALGLAASTSLPQL